MTDRATVEQVRTLIRACEGVAELAAITGKAASSRPDANTDVMVLALWKIRAFIAAPELLRALLDRAEKLERERDVALKEAAKLADLLMQATDEWEEQGI